MPKSKIIQVAPAGSYSIVMLRADGTVEIWKETANYNYILQCVLEEGSDA